MFKHLFSFKGRIGRTEFGLTLVIYFACCFVLFLMLLAFESRWGIQLVFWLLMLLLWFRLAQGAKRCHDIGLSGWYQLIPLYSIILLIEKEKEAFNKYGLSPKIAIVEEACKIISIYPDRVLAEDGNGKLISLPHIKLPSFARPGDCILHVQNGEYKVVDEAGNEVFRM